MNKLAGKRVLIFQQRNWALNIGHFLAKKLQAEGCELAAVTLKKSTHKYVSNQTEVKYQEIVNIDDIMENPEKYLQGKKITLEEICRDFKIGSVWQMLHSNRSLVRSYRQKFYYSYRQNKPDEFIVSYFTAYYKTLGELFKKFKPDLVIIVSFISEKHMMFKWFADKYGIPLISVADAKVSGYNFFASDEFCFQTPMRDKFFALQAGQAVSPNAAKAQQYISDFRKNFIHPAYASDEETEESLWRKIRHNLSPLRQIYNFYTKPEFRENRNKSIGPTTDYRPPRIILRDWWCYKKYKKFAQNYKYYPLDKINKFVFYPLKFTPEGNIDLMCPLYNNQIELARQIAMSLPGDYTLVAREHPAMVGYRTPSYLEKIAQTPNVKLIDYRIPIEDVLKKTDLIVNTYSTTFFEASFYYKPAIMLMDSGIFELLPNVFKHKDLSSLTQKIKEVLAVNLKSPAYDKQLENYISAVFDVGFDFDYVSAWDRGGDMEELWQIYKKEIERLI